MTTRPRIDTIGMGEGRHDGRRRALQITLGVVSAIPFLSGLAGTLSGTTTLPGLRHPVDATVESEYRFAHAFWFASAPILWGLIPRIERRSAPLRQLAAVLFTGGLMRLVAWRKAGRPHPAFIAAAALEIVGMPVLALWQSHVARLARLDR